MDEELWADSRQYLESLAAQSTSGTSISVTHEVLCGEPTEMICRRIDEVNADLVGMTSHGLTGLAQAWFGRVAEGVLATAPSLCC